jgi:hypothetical protein
MITVVPDQTASLEREIAKLRKINAVPSISSGNSCYRVQIQDWQRGTIDTAIFRPSQTK